MIFFRSTVQYVCLNTIEIAHENLVYFGIRDIGAFLFWGTAYVCVFILGYGKLAFINLVTWGSSTGQKNVIFAEFYLGCRVFHTIYTKLLYIGKFSKEFYFANSIKRHICDVRNSRLGHDIRICISVNDRVILPFFAISRGF